MLLAVAPLVVAPLVLGLLPLDALELPLLDGRNLLLLLVRHTDHAQLASGDESSALAVAAGAHDLLAVLVDVRGILVVRVVALVRQQLLLQALLGRRVVVQVLAVVGAQAAVAGSAAGGQVQLEVVPVGVLRGVVRVLVVAVASLVLVVFLQALARLAVDGHGGDLVGGD